MFLDLPNGVLLFVFANGIVLVVIRDTLNSLRKRKKNWRGRYPWVA